MAVAELKVRLRLRWFFWPLCVAGYVWHLLSGKSPETIAQWIVSRGVEVQGEVHDG